MIVNWILNDRVHPEQNIQHSRYLQGAQASGFSPDVPQALPSFPIPAPLL